MRRPVIGLTANYVPAARRDLYDTKAMFVAEESMVDRIVDAGGVPLVLPIVADTDVRRAFLDAIDGLLLTGGHDVDDQPARADFEIWITQHVRSRRLPVLGICRGIQLLNVACGGSLLSDIQTVRPACHTHRDAELYDGLRHPVVLAPNTWLTALYGGKTDVDTNSIHHQAIDVLGDGLEPLAWSDDGLIEAVHAPADRWTRAVQWHPEWDESAPNVGLFETFVTECGA